MYIEYNDYDFEVTIKNKVHKFESIAYCECSDTPKDDEKYFVVHYAIDCEYPYNEQLFIVYPNYGYVDYYDDSKKPEVIEKFREFVVNSDVNPKYKIRDPRKRKELEEQQFIEKIKKDFAEKILYGRRPLK